MIIFKSLLTTFKWSVVFWGSLGCCKKMCSSLKSNYLNQVQLSEINETLCSLYLKGCSPNWLRPGFNFTNVFRACFSYECLFLVTFKLVKRRYKKRAQKNVGEIDPLSLKYKNIWSSKFVPNLTEVFVIRSYIELKTNNTSKYFFSFFYFRVDSVARIS